MISPAQRPDASPRQFALPPAPAAAAQTERALGCFALGLLLPLLAGGNVLVQLEPRTAIPLFAAAALGFAALAIRDATAPRERLPAAEVAPLLVFVSWWSGQAFLRPAGARTFLEALGLLAGAALFVILRRRPFRGEELERFVLGIVTGALVTTVYGQYQHWIMFPSLKPLMIELYGQGPFLSVNANFYSANCYAPFLAAVLLLAAGAAFDRDSWPPRTFLWLAIAGLAVTLVLTGSRATVGLLVLAVLAIVLTDRIHGRRRRLVLAATLGVVATAGWLSLRWLQPHELWTESVLGRLDIWRGAWAMIRDHWLLGVGPGGFAENFYAYRVSDYYTRYPHNLFLEVVSETGIVGLTALASFVAVAFAASFRSIRSGGPPLRRHAFAAAVLLFAHSMVDIDWRAPANPILLLVLLAAVHRPRPEAMC